MGKRTGRREWLSMVARGAAASTVGVLGSPRAVRSNDVGGDPRIKHIVVLMMENRSFDHMFGLLMSEIPGLRGVREGEWTNVDDKGNVHALTADAAYQGQLRVDPPHDFWSVNDQILPIRDSRSRGRRGRTCGDSPRTMRERAATRPTL
jgi:phospholipase C